MVVSFVHNSAYHVAIGYHDPIVQAVVGSIDLIAHNPEVITFGAPRVILQSSKCSTINETRHFRFINTDNRRRYDFAPCQINFFGERHVGIPMFLEHINFPILSPAFDDNRARMPCSLDIHLRAVYLERVDGLLNGDCFPIPVAKWPEGRPCR
jgi:hypothetical protein